MTDDEKRELIAEAREWVQEENWESDHERAGFNRPGTGLIARLADALEGTLTEPEWEWALRAVGDGEPFSDVYESRENLADCENGIAWQPEELVRRRKAGPWLLVEGGSNGA